MGTGGEHGLLNNAPPGAKQNPDDPKLRQTKRTLEQNMDEG
jgi:hypothetical protein